MSRSPVSSPAAPAAGCRVAASMPGDLAQRLLELDQQLAASPGCSDAGAAGWTSARPGRPATASQTLGLYFIVHDPSG